MARCGLNLSLNLSQSRVATVHRKRYHSSLRGFSHFQCHSNSSQPGKGQGLVPFTSDLTHVALDPSRDLVLGWRTASDPALHYLIPVLESDLQPGWSVSAPGRRTAVLHTHQAGQVADSIGG